MEIIVLPAENVLEFLNSRLWHWNAEGEKENLDFKTHCSLQIEYIEYKIISYVLKLKRATFVGHLLATIKIRNLQPIEYDFG